MHGQYLLHFILAGHTHVIINFNYHLTTNILSQGLLVGHIPVHVLVHDIINFTYHHIH